MWSCGLRVERRFKRRAGTLPSGTRISARTGRYVVYVTSVCALECLVADQAESWSCVACVAHGNVGGGWWRLTVGDALSLCGLLVQVVSDA